MNNPNYTPYRLLLPDEIEKLAQTVPRIKRIYNEIIIRSPESAITEASDAWITTKVKTRMLSAKGFRSGKIKVITENGIVYLMGKITKQQADMAADITRRTSGVQKVVKVFSYA